MKADITPPLFTILVHTYNRPHYLKKMVESLVNQTYRNLEIFLVSDGGTKETLTCIKELESSDSRINSLLFPHNFYTPETPEDYLIKAINPALKKSSGDYILFQADDDVLSLNYFEKMASLFLENPACVACTPGTSVSIDKFGNRLDRHESSFPRYMEGYKVGIALLKKDPYLKMAPLAQALTIRRDVLEGLGGFNLDIDRYAVFGFAASGILGCDNDAIFYYRKHADQLNKTLKKTGQQHGWRKWEKVAKDTNVFSMWEKITDKKTAIYVKKELRKCHAKSAYSSLTEYFLQLNFIGIKNTVKHHLRLSYFWLYLPLYLVFLPLILLVKGGKSLIRYIVMKALKKVFTHFPRIGELNATTKKYKSKLVLGDGQVKE